MACESRAGRDLGLAGGDLLAQVRQLSGHEGRDQRVFRGVVMQYAALAQTGLDRDRVDGQPPGSAFAEDCCSGFEDDLGPLSQPPALRFHHSPALKTDWTVCN
jgi:hypothetical protein